MAEKSKVLSLRLEQDLLESLQAIADREGIPLSYIIRRALRKALNMPVSSKESPVKLPDTWE